MKKLKIPYGVGNYKTLVEEDYYFVDKTSFIEKLENLDEKTLVFLRPRRFGKSLFLSMLNYYYGNI
ncbi:MAG: 9-O-acetyl-N-acetylneuraminate esterase, partial [Candidatus Cloacimonadota bacterium]